MKKRRTSREAKVSASTLPVAPAGIAVAGGGAENPAQRKKARQAEISPADRLNLYAAGRALGTKTRQAVGLQIPFTVYVQDPSFAARNPDQAFDRELLVDWEPGLSDGPTSSRFAVVDFDADTGRLTPPAQWDEGLQKFVFGGRVLDDGATTLPQFHQVNVWALLQRALVFFEEGNGLGRRIPWAFEGNRLIVVPHAGYGENAFYDRASKSLQFYYFGSGVDTVQTCLSADIVHHEFGHAVLDGVRPHLSESCLVETAAFHEAMGDLTAILLTLRNNGFRNFLAGKSNGRLGKVDDLSWIAEQFGREVAGRPYLRSATNRLKMQNVVGRANAHEMSQVLVGAMYDVLLVLAKHYQRGPDAASPNGSGGEDRLSGSRKRPRTSPSQAFWHAAERLQRMAIQPLDLLPPVDVTFRDYAIAVCRAELLANPLDPYNYYDKLIRVFTRRGILNARDARQLRAPQYLYDRLRLQVTHDIDDIARSRAAAYRFLDDNREDLLIPANRDFFVTDLYDSQKSARQGARMPRQIILEYVWREEVLLDGERFGRFAGQTTTLLCGGTMVFDDSGIVLNWSHKPGPAPFGRSSGRKGKIVEKWAGAVREGRRRQDELLDHLATQIAAGRVGTIAGSTRGLLASHVPPFVSESDGRTVQFRFSPHLHLSEDQHHDHDEGARRWEISC